MANCVIVGNYPVCIYYHGCNAPLSLHLPNGLSVRLLALQPHFSLARTFQPAQDTHCSSISSSIQRASDAVCKDSDKSPLGPQRGCAWRPSYKSSCCHWRQQLSQYLLNLVFILFIVLLHAFVPSKLHQLMGKCVPCWRQWAADRRNRDSLRHRSSTARLRHLTPSQT